MGLPNGHAGASGLTYVPVDALSAAALRLDVPGLVEEMARQLVEVGCAREVAVGVVEGTQIKTTVWGIAEGELAQIKMMVLAVNSGEPIAEAVRNRSVVHGEHGASAVTVISADLVVPIIANERAVGAVAVKGSGDDTDLLAQIVMDIASRSALALEYVRIHKQSSKTLEETVTVLAAVIEGRDAYTESHCLHIAEMSLGLGVRMGLGRERLDRLSFGGLLHDIGKIAVPDAILTKAGTLTDREFDQMKTHSSVGEDILGRIGSLEAVAPIVGQHHERLDGSGYPRGLKGDDILLEARILAVADTFDAMTTARPYRRALPWSRAVEEIISGRGTMFDPEVVDTFTQYISGEEAQWQTKSPI